MSRLIRRFRDAARGVKFALGERSMRLHLIAAAIVVALSVLLRISAIEWCAVLLCIALVIALEMFNSAIERLCDKLHPERDTKIGAVKDMCAGAILVAAIVSAVIGCVVFAPKIINIFQNIQ
jgi:diacylglycerol kinase